MDNYITPEELRNLGVKLEGDALQKLIDELDEKIDTLVGDEIIDSLTPEDVEKLAELQDSASDEALAEWIVEHVPDYPEIIENNKDIVLGEYVETLDNDERNSNE